MLAMSFAIHATAQSLDPNYVSFYICIFVRNAWVCVLYRTPHKTTVSN